jgi:diguanylate cyclase (GGDEF)-like protein
MVLTTDPSAELATKILIVDDDPIVLEVMKGLVGAYGFNFGTATDGLEATKELKKDSYAIVITDINMPNMDGMELLKFVNENYPKTGVIVVTGLTDTFSYVEVINAGAIDYITKPFDGGELLAKLKRVIREQALVNELEKKSISDALTNLYNRRHFDTKIEEELHRAFRQEYVSILALIDIDNFKGYNDTNGHQSGDKLLATLGNILLKCARQGVDFAFRYGGDEFALIITHASIDQAQAVLERVMESFNSYNFGETTLSCGVCEFKRYPEFSWEEDIKDFVNVVDSALYKAKEKGKNQVAVVTR